MITSFPLGAGLLMALLGLVALFMVMGEGLNKPNRSLKLYQWAIILPYLATTAGWLKTELGRIPWVVYGLMKIEAGVSNTVPAYNVLITLIAYTLVYAALMVADIYLLTKFARKVPRQDQAEGSELEIDIAPSLVGSQD